MQHYSESIHALGTMDGFNTESPKCLHIELAKDRYCVSNKKDYLEQMALWLQHCKGIWKWEAYLQWVQDAADVAQTERLEEVEEAIDGKTSGWTSEANYHIAKKPACYSVTVKHLISKFGTVNFISTLAIWLCEHCPASSIAPNAYDQFDIFKQVIIRMPFNPHIRSKPQMNHIQTTPAMAPQGQKGGMPVYFNTVLVVENPREYQPQVGLSGVFIISLYLSPLLTVSLL